MENQKGLSRHSYHDMYYDGFIGANEGFDEDSQEIIHIRDYWNFKISKEEPGYIEDMSDEWYLDMMSGKIERIK